MIKAIIFDMDDTLIQTIKVKWQALKLTSLNHYGLILTDENIKKHWGLPFEIFISKVLPEIPDTKDFKAKYINVSKSFSAEAHPKASEILTTLSNSFVLGAVTATPRDLIEKDLFDAKIDMNLFSFIQTSDETEFHKPNSRVFDPVIQKLSQKNITKDATIYVGDSILDYQAARDAGLKFLAVTTGINKKEDFLKQGLEKKYINHNLVGVYAFFISET